MSVKRSRRAARRRAARILRDVPTASREQSLPGGHTAPGRDRRRQRRRERHRRHNQDNDFEDFGEE